MFSHPRHSKWRGYVPNLQIKPQWQQNFFWINLWFANERQVHGEGEQCDVNVGFNFTNSSFLHFRSGRRSRVLAVTSLWTRGRWGAAPSPCWTPSLTPRATGCWRPGTPPTGSTPSPVSPLWSPRASGDLECKILFINQDLSNLYSRYLELHGLNTVGIFRVGSNKKRVDKVDCLL